jgi:1,4-alpha-glucan branching enzyme
MHDSLLVFAKDPVHRRWHHDQLTFAMLYEYSERFLMPLSHDEVVHGKGSLLSKMPGDVWQKFANLRVLLAYQWTRPGKQLVFQGTELAPWREWNHDEGLEWGLAADAPRAGLARWLEDLGRLYREDPALWRLDHDPAGFAWIDCSDRENSILAYVRRDGDRHVVVVLNLTPRPHEDYRIGVPAPVTYVERLCSDGPEYGGSGWPTAERIEAAAVPWHGLPWSLNLRIPPLAALVLAPA